MRALPRDATRVALATSLFIAVIGSFYLGYTGVQKYDAECIARSPSWIAALLQQKPPPLPRWCGYTDAVLTITERVLRNALDYFIYFAAGRPFWPILSWAYTANFFFLASFIYIFNGSLSRQ